MTSFFAQSRDRLAREVPLDPILARLVARRLFAAVYRDGVDDWGAMRGLPPGVRRWLERDLELSPLDVALESRSTDGSRKVLFRLPDGQTVESVLIPRTLQEDRPLSRLDAMARRLRRMRPSKLARRLRPRALFDDARRWLRRPAGMGMTACISTQVGCAMGCGFCQTGEQGLLRDLTVDEIVGQVVALRRMEQVDSIVFMGMGEPLHNTANVIEACRILKDAAGLDYGGRQIIVNTVGLTPQIERLAREVEVHLGVSLNATTDELRRQLMPIGKKWSIASLLDACRAYTERSLGPVLVGYVLLDGVNDGDDDARRLAALVEGMDVLVTLIPHNEYATSPFRKPPRQRSERFKEIVERAGVLVAIREPGGEDIAAACGQLRSSALKDGLVELGLPARE